MKLLPNEEVLTTSNDDKIILTNHRIQMTCPVWGESYSISIFLDDISSIVIKNKRNVLFIVLCVICLVGGVCMAIEGASESMIVGLVLGGLFFALWWFSRKYIISISPDGGASLNFMVQEMGEETINEFIHDVSLAKQSRINQLYKL